MSNPHPVQGATFFGAVRAEILHLAASRWDLVCLFVVPPLLLVVIGAMFSSGVVRQIPVAVVDQDRSDLSRMILRNMQASPDLRLIATPQDLHAAWPLMRAGKIYSVAYLPKGLSSQALRKPQAVTVYYNAAFQTVGDLAARAQMESITAAAKVQIVARAHAMGVPALEVAAPSVQVTIRGNPQASFEWFLGGLIAPGVLHLLMACSAVMAYGRELKGRSWAAWSAQTGGALLAFLVGKAVPHVLVFSLWGLAWLAWLTGWRGWGIAGSPAMLMAGMIILMAATAAISALLVAATGDMDVAYSATAIYAGSAIAFSNGTLPLAHGPVFAQVWSVLLPYTHYLRLQNAQAVMGADASASLPDLLLLVALTLLLGLVAFAFARRRAKAPEDREPVAFNLEGETISGTFISTFRSIFATRAVASLLVLAVVAYAFYYPLAYTGQTAVKLPLAIVDEDHSPLSRQMIRHLDATRTIQTIAIAGGYRDAQRQLRNGQVDGVILIPSGFQARLRSGAPHGVAMELDGAHLVRASSLGKAVTAAIAGMASEASAPLDRAAHLSERLPKIVERPLYNTAEGYGSYAVPAVSAIILQQTLLLGAALIAAIRRESRAPRLQARQFLGLWLALTTVGVLGSLFYAGFVFWFQDYPRMGNLTGMVMLSTLFAGATSALGLTLGTWFQRHEQVMQIIVGTSVPLFFLGGAAWPAFMMPTALQWVADIVPTTSAIPAWVKLNAAGARVDEIAPHLLVLATLLIAYLCMAWLRFRPSRQLSVANPQSEGGLS